MDRLTPIVQSYSVLAITLAAGTNLSTTLVTLPALLNTPPSALASSWNILYDTGFTPVITLCMSSSAGFAWLAYRAASTPLLTATGVSHVQRNLYAGAALAAFGLVPYTKLLMWSNIESLKAKAESKGVGEKGGEKETERLVRQWGTMNLWRGVMLLSSGVLGIWACVS